MPRVDGRHLARGPAPGGGGGLAERLPVRGDEAAGVGEAEPERDLSDVVAPVRTAEQAPRRRQPPVGDLALRRRAAA